MGGVDCGKERQTVQGSLTCSPPVTHFEKTLKVIEKSLNALSTWEKKTRTQNRHAGHRAKSTQIFIVVFFFLWMLIKGATLNATHSFPKTFKAFSYLKYEKNSATCGAQFA